MNGKRQLRGGTTASRINGLALKALYSLPRKAFAKIRPAQEMPAPAIIIVSLF
jgi:hypothetical protein